MSSIRVSNRLRAKRFKTGTATAEDKAYIEKKYGGPCDMNGYVSPFPPGEDPYVKEWTYTPLPSNYVEKKAQKKRPERALSKDNKVVEDRVRCEVIPLSKPTLIIEEVVEETFTQNDAIYLNSLVQDRTNKMRNLLKLDEEIEKLQKKRANHVSEKCVEMTPERFRNALIDLGYIKK